MTKTYNARSCRTNRIWGATRKCDLENRMAYIYLYITFLAPLQ